MSNGETDSMKIGSLEIEGKIGLAPMAGVTDSAFRRVCARFGAGWSVTEMISAKAVEFGDKKSLSLGDVSRDEGPVFLQLFGSEPETVALAARRLLGEDSPLPKRPAGLDLNMGCPMPKIVNNGAGSALLKDPALCGRIVEAARKATDLPLTVKLRTGWDREHVNAVEVARLCESAGADAVCVHGRTRDQLYQGKADWETIASVKAALRIPVMGNGDVTDGQTAAQLLAQTNCDGILIGRGALGNPWVFRAVNLYLTDHCTILPEPTIAERIVTLRRHMELLCAEKGEARGMREARMHVGWYVHGVKGAAEFRRRAGELCTLADLDALIRDLYQAQGGMSNEQ